MDQRSPRPAVRPDLGDADDEPGGFALVFPLIALAGFIGALGLVQWHGLFVSFMSGNTVALVALHGGFDGLVLGRPEGG